MLRYLGALLPLLALLTACGTSIGGGGPDRVSAARSVEKEYWQDVHYAKFSKAYALLSSGVQQSTPLKSFTQSMFGFLEQTNGVNAIVGKPTVVGDCALVPVALVAEKAPTGALHAAQHMYWVNGAWRITEANGGLYAGKAKLTSCPTGT